MMSAKLFGFCFFSQQFTNTFADFLLLFVALAVVSALNEKLNSSPLFSSHRHTTPEKFFIEACDEGADAVLAIDRVSNEMTLTGRMPLKGEVLCAPLMI